MKKAQLINPGRIKIVEVSDKPEPKAGEALIRIKAAGICGSDKHSFEDGGIGGIFIEEPFVLGHEAMGIVEAVGPNTPEDLVGLRVAIEPAIPCGQCQWCLRGDINVCPEVRFLGTPPTEGAFQEYLVHPVAQLCPVPDSLTDEEAVLLEPLSIVVHTFDLAKLRFGSRIALLGSGPIGLLSIWMAQHFMPEVLLATDLYDYRLQAAKKAGATHTANASKTDIIQYADEITEGQGFDYVIEAASSDETAHQMVEIAGPGAKTFFIGITPSDQITFRHASSRRKGLTVFMIRRSRLTLERSLNVILDSKKNNGVSLEKLLISHRVPFEDSGSILKTSAEFKDNVLKPIITI